MAHGIDSRSQCGLVQDMKLAQMAYTPDSDARIAYANMGAVYPEMTKERLASGSVKISCTPTQSTLCSE
ncbi:hypothetical protein K431DRAFT_347931 [Polychaeton citri CBS 116435]|uniref:Uncharacterized protein n=1 Tax=Polychaeton citri CBS 116435 TaxID=1314669 RepID=A0A9P4Q778_9PEZI|nr:hypothetical protein K431DRAFT_347931 [Polychaeton citri CBS 116435]